MPIENENQHPNTPADNRGLNAKPILLINANEDPLDLLYASRGPKMSPNAQKSPDFMPELTLGEVQGNLQAQAPIGSIFSTRKDAEQSRSVTALSLLEGTKAPAT